MDTTFEHSLKIAKTWLSEPFDETTRQEVERLIHNDPETLKECFYKNLDFGTGGMRGIMGVGTNRVNAYTLGKNTQGLSNYLKKTYPDTPLRVVIAYDCRHNSASLAKTVADVFAANGIDVFLFSALRPTPELSFAVKYLKCHCGIVLTASHNPPEYNGYKVYWTDGGQLVAPQDAEVIRDIEGVNFSDVRFDANATRIQYIADEVDEAFIEASVQHGSFNAEGKADFSVVFTPLHGTAVTILPEVLKRAGYPNVHVVSEQAVPNGDFPTVHSPNPEEPEALSMALQKAEDIGADMVIGTDPDSDRLGIAVRGLDGRMLLLNGNQTMVMMTKFLLDHWKSKGLKGNEFIGSTIVSTPMMHVLANRYGVECKAGLTGFKWIAKMIRDFPEQPFIGGGEESFGFMAGDFVRDKDAVTASLLACEIGAGAKARGSSFYEALINCYMEFGFYKERLISIVKKGIRGAKEIRQMMTDLRDHPPISINGAGVVRIEDYKTSVAKDVLTGTETVLAVPESDVLIYYTTDGSKIAARPSGTEPKIKFYFSVNAALNNRSDFAKTEAMLEAKIAAIINDMNLNE
ncbi:MAG: phospho-sugar mutase [Bacteroidota bacterium]